METQPCQIVLPHYEQPQILQAKGRVFAQPNYRQSDQFGLYQQYLHQNDL
jgi:hypothetical protein